MDATGHDTDHASRYYSRRAGKRRRRRHRPELTAVLETVSRLFLSAHVSRGPGRDSPRFKPAARPARARRPLDTPPGDAAYDAEHNHA